MVDSWVTEQRKLIVSAGNREALDTLLAAARMKGFGLVRKPNGQMPTAEFRARGCVAGTRAPACALNKRKPMLVYTTLEDTPHNVALLQTAGLVADAKDGILRTRTGSAREAAMVVEHCIEPWLRTAR